VHARGYRQGTHHPGDRPGDGDDGVGRHTPGGEQAQVRAARGHHHPVQLDHAAAARPPLRRRDPARRGLQARHGRGRGAFLQHERNHGYHGGPGEGRCAAGGPQGGYRGRGVHAAAGKTDDHLLRPGGQAPGPGDGAGAPEPARDTAPGRRRGRACHRHHPRLLEPDFGKGGGGEI
ncbi:MAG: RuvC, partial [uncultured Rubrobacteraceae bacterium]